MKELNKKCFSRREIKKFEKAREELIQKLDFFVASANFVKEHYYVTRKSVYEKEYSMAWIDNLKKQINSIHLERFKTASKNVEEKRFKIIIRYFGKISLPVFKEFDKVDSPIKEMIEEYEEQVIKILNM